MPNADLKSLNGDRGLLRVEADEEGAVKDQLRPLSDGNELLSLWKQCEKRSSIPGVIAKDADYLEKAFTAKEYTETGHKSAVDWIKNVKKHLQTKSAKTLLEEMVKMIVAQRAYAINSKAVQASDEMMQISNNMKR